MATSPQQPNTPIEADENSIIINCENCQFPVRVDRVKLEQHNAGSFSAIMWVHRIHNCANCGYRIVGQIVGFDPRLLRFTFIAVPPQKEEAPSLIV